MIKSIVDLLRALLTPILVAIGYGKGKRDMAAQARAEALEREVRAHEVKDEVEDLSDSAARDELRQWVRENDDAGL